MALIVLYCIIPFYWMVVSSLRLPTEGRSTEFIPNPASLANYKGVFSAGNNFGRSLVNSIIVSGVDHGPHPVVRHRGGVRAGAAEHSGARAWCSG